MSTALAINIILMGIVLVGIVAVHHWAIRTQHHDPHFGGAGERRRSHDRRRHVARPGQTAAERRRGDRRAGAPVTA